MAAPGRNPGALPFLVLSMLLGLWLTGSPAQAAPTLLEDLHYRVVLLSIQDAARVRVTLWRRGPGRLSAEAVAVPQEVIRPLTGSSQDRLQTEMVWWGGRFRPLVYREESRSRSKRRLKEYRFNYARKRLEMWELKRGRGLVKKWETRLSEPVYDALSIFYNCRLGIMGPTREGETVTIPMIPYPRPEAVKLHQGAENEESRQVIISMANQSSEDYRALVYVLLNKHLVPLRAWTNIFGVNISGDLLPESQVFSGGLRELTGAGPLASGPQLKDKRPAAAGGGQSP